MALTVAEADMAITDPSMLRGTAKMRDHEGSTIQRGAGVWLGAVALAAMLQGCTALKGFPDRSFDLAAEITELKPYLGPGAITTYNTKPDDASKKAWRNEVIEARLRADDLNFLTFEQALYSQGIGSGIGTDWILLALNGAGSLAGSAANALSAAATGVTGARASFDKNAMFEKTLPVLLAQMVAKRKTVLVRIRQGETQEVNAYPLLMGLSDLEDYYFAGTIPGAIGEVAANAGAQGKEADKDLKAILVGLVPADVQLRREKAADYIKTKLSATQHDLLSKSLGRSTGANALGEVLQAISQAETAAKFDLIDQKITILFGPSWRN